MPAYNFLGQTINIGLYGGFPDHRTILKEMASAFSVIKFIQDNFDDPFEKESDAIFFNEGATITFAIAYCHTTENGLRTFIKIATSLTGPLDPEDRPPRYAPWNDWYMLGTQYSSYGGIEDPDNITVQDYFLNSFMFFQQDASLYPYYRTIYGLSTAEECRGNAPVNFILNTNGLRNYDGTALTEYTGPTPIDLRGGGVTNYPPGEQYIPYDPSYTIGRIGMGEIYLYNPLHIDDSIYINDFTDDSSTSGGGGGGDYGYGGDNLSLMGPISLNALDTGFLTMFSPTKAQLHSLSDFMWSDNLVDNLKKAVAQPMDAIIMFGIVPLDLSSIRDSTASEVVIGNVPTGVSMFKINQQVITVDFGTVNIRENWHHALDYEPFTECSLYLPGCGFVPLKLNEVMSSVVQLVYYVDLLSGDFVAHIKCSRNDKYIPNTNTITYIHRGNLLINVPITGADYSRFYKAIALAPLNFGKGAMTGNPVGGIASGVASATSALLESAEIQRSGNFSGSIAGMMYRQPFILLHRPIQQLPREYSKYIGYPSYIRYKLSQLKGYTMVDSVIDNTVAAPDDEKAEIERLLKEGVIL